MKTVKMNIRVNKDINQKAEKVFSSLGLTNSQAVNMFFSQVVLSNGIPFDIKIPSYYNEKTMKVIEDAENGEGLLNCKSNDDFFKCFK
mgnify:FL=1|jgi:DNA-damage-inducible protein J